MSTWQTIALGAVAGFTIFLGLPLAPPGLWIGDHSFLGARTSH